jgi:hypothetical protein
MSMPGEPYPAPRPTIRFDAINQAWQLLQQQMGQWVVLSLVFVIVSAVANFALSMIPVLGIVVGGLPGAILSAGMYKSALKQMRGETIAVGDLFDVSDVIGPILVAAILTSIGTAIGFVCCILPGFVLISLWAFTNLLIVDRGMDGVAAMRESFNALRGEWLMAGVFALVVGLVVAAGGLACGVGLLFTLPLGVLSVTVLYRDFFPESEAAAPESFTVPPTL